MNREPAQGERGRSRRRVVASLLSLFALIALLAGLLSVRASQEQLGEFASITTSSVTISIGGPASVPADQSAMPDLAASRSPGYGSRLRSYILSGDELESGTYSTQWSSGSWDEDDEDWRSPTPRATSTSGSQTTPTATSTGLPSTATATRTPTSQPTWWSRSPTPRPTRTPVPTFDPGDATAFGTNSHLRIDELVAPGAYTTGGIIVSNIGQVAFYYSVSMSTSGDATFAQTLRFRIYLRVGSTCDYQGAPASPASDFAALTGDQTGTELYRGDFATGNKLGDPTVEFALGDRFLDIGQSEVLCMEVFFPWTAGNEYQGQAVNGTLIFTAKSPE